MATKREASPEETGRRSKRAKTTQKRKTEVDEDEESDYVPSDGELTNSADGETVTQGGVKTRNRRRRFANAAQDTPQDEVKMERDVTIAKRLARFQGTATPVVAAEDTASANDDMSQKQTIATSPLQPASTKETKALRTKSNNIGMEVCLFGTYERTKPRQFVEQAQVADDIAPDAVCVCSSCTAQRKNAFDLAGNQADQRDFEVKHGRGHSLAGQGSRIMF
ncbi:uncharacterized protein BKA78DRAFT_187671 [Phyllosticta capitalensis]|uniref:uncharacterized protein n=1 Tax=Phyllosticta capitalensis TaxID=121624 RepID=UPI003130939E